MALQSPKRWVQRSSERIEGKSGPPRSGWKIVPKSRTGCRETPVAKFVVCSWHEQLPDVVGMRPQRTTTSVRQKMTVSKIRGSSTSERLMHEPGDLERDSLTNCSSQCSCLSTGVMWSLRRAPVTRRAARCKMY